MAGNRAGGNDSSRRRRSGKPSDCGLSLVYSDDVKGTRYTVDEFTRDAVAPRRPMHAFDRDQYITVSDYYALVTICRLHEAESDFHRRTALGLCRAIRRHRRRILDRRLAVRGADWLLWRAVHGQGKARRETRPGRDAPG